MSIESLNPLTPEEQVDLEKQRLNYAKETQEEADRRNNQRGLVEKLTGKNKVSAIDIAHEEALKENILFEVEKRFEVPVSATESSFDKEMQAANNGEWNRSKSRFAFTDVEEDKERIRQLTEANNATLDSIFQQEMELVENGEWNPESSRLQVSEFYEDEVDELKRRKNTLFESLKQLQEGEIKKGEEKILKTLEEKLKDEKSAIEAGVWDPEKSSIRLTSLDTSSSYELSRKATQMFDQLKEYEAKVISDQEQARIGEEYRREELLAGNGEWTRDQSYFFTLQQDPRFQKFSSRLREDIQRKLVDLGMMNMQKSGDEGRNRTNETEKEDTSSQEEQIEKAMSILGVTSRDSFLDAQKAYRRFMMKNHPDRNPQISNEIAQQLVDLTQSWPVLEKFLKRNG